MERSKDDDPPPAPILSPDSPDKNENDKEEQQNRTFPHLMEIYIPPISGFIRKIIWMDSLRRIAEHTLFDHSGKVPTVIYSTQAEANDFAGNYRKTSQPIGYKIPNVNIPPQTYREPQTFNSSGSDTTPAKKARQTLVDFEPTSFPLIPDFSDMRNQEVEGYPLNLSVAHQPHLGITDNLLGLDLSISSTTVTRETQDEPMRTTMSAPSIATSTTTLHSSTASAPSTPMSTSSEPILDRMWRSPVVKPDPGETILCDSPCMSDDERPVAQASKSKFVFDKVKLAKLGETISAELAKIRLESDKKREAASIQVSSPETRKRKIQIEKIFWDPISDGGEVSERNDTSPNSNGQPTRRVTYKQSPESEPETDSWKRDKKILRKCRLCNRPTANMKNHLAFSHLKENWWGVLADQTCWSCRDYHPLWKIQQCDGFYRPAVHKNSLLCRHREFLERTMEDFEIVSPEELVSIVRNMKLCDKSVSGFSEREEYFLKEIDKLYCLPEKQKHSSLIPTRPSELIHWRTIIEILAYTRERGAISSSTTPRKLISLIDTRCDLIREYENLNHNGLLFFLPPITALAGRVRIKSVVSEIVDPRQLSSPAFNTIRRDPMVKLSLGIRPDAIQLADRQYLDFCHNMANSVQVVAIGPVGIDLSLNHVSANKQMYIYKQFVHLANTSGKPLRIYFTQNHEMSFEIAEKGLPRGHPIHLVNFCGSIKEATRFKQAFDNGYLGISSIACNPPPYFVEAIRNSCIDRLLLESNAPYSTFENSPGSHPTDVAKILAAVAEMKDINVNTVAKYFRRNTCTIYRY